MYLLDTNIVIYALNRRYPKVADHIFSTHPAEIVISCITVSELEYGAAKSHWGGRTRELMRAFLANYAILPFSDRDAILFGQIRARLDTSGKEIGLLDAMIGVQGVSRGYVVVTHNTREFSRIPGIRLEDWTEE